MRASDTLIKILPLMVGAAIAVSGCGGAAGAGAAPAVGAAEEQKEETGVDATETADEETEELEWDGVETPKNTESLLSREYELNAGRLLVGTVLDIDNGNIFMDLSYIANQRDMPETVVAFNAINGFYESRKGNTNISIIVIEGKKSCVITSRGKDETRINSDGARAFQGVPDWLKKELPDELTPSQEETRKGVVDSIDEYVAELDSISDKVKAAVEAAKKAAAEENSNSNSNAEENSNSNSNAQDGSNSNSNAQDKSNSNSNAGNNSNTNSNSNKK